MVTVLSHLHLYLWAQMSEALGFLPSKRNCIFFSYSLLFYPRITSWRICMHVNLLPLFLRIAVGVSSESEPRGGVSG